MNFLHVVTLLQTHLVCSTDTAEAGYVTTATKSAGGRRHTASLGGTENAVVIREVDGEIKLRKGRTFYGITEEELGCCAGFQLRRI
jgi:hypothetical protein